MTFKSLATKTLATAFGWIVLSLPAHACGGSDERCSLPSGNYYMAEPAAGAAKGIVVHLHGGGGRAVSYTHLTLPTIYSV